MSLSRVVKGNDALDDFDEAGADNSSWSKEGRLKHNLSSEGWAEACGRWCEEARSSLRGRRLFTLFALINFVNYLDRGVIPGGSQEFNVFIRGKLHTERPDVFLGILQSIFILGFSVACLVFARLARRYSPFTLMAGGLGVWSAAGVLAGLAKPLGSYEFLLLARLLSGVGEASFVTVVPPLITETAPPGERGLWLAVFYTAQPVGAGVGYVYGSLLATSSLGWQWAFYFEALVMAPLALTCGLVPHEDATAAPNASDYGASPGAASCVTATNGDVHAGTERNAIINRSPARRSYDAIRSPVEEDTCRGHQSSPAGGRHLSSTMASAPGARGHGGQGLVAADAHDVNGHLKNSRSRRGRRADRVIDGEQSIDVNGEGPQEESGDAAFGTSSGWYAIRGNSTPRSSNAGDGLRDAPQALLRLEEGSCDEEGCTELGAEMSTDGKTHAVGTDRQGGLVVSPPVGVEHRGQGTDSEREIRRAIGLVESVNRTGSGFSVNDTLEESAAKSGSALVRDVLKVVDRVVFCLVVLGAAAAAAMTAGISTFGTGLVINLELFSSETAAAATFGGVICAAGLTGTPSGGALIDAADPEGRLGDGRKLLVVLKQAAALMCGATVLVITATAQTSLIPFLIFFFCGATLLFATTAHANLAVMLAAPKHLRPLSLAVNSISLHALGDVPSPTVFGAVKDALAPNCAAAGGVTASRGMTKSLRRFVASALGKFFIMEAGSKGGENNGDVHAGWAGVAQSGWEGGEGLVGGISAACRKERGGLHLTLFLIASWLLWTCLFFSLARAVQEVALEHGMGPVSWGDIGDLLSKGLLRPAWTRKGCCTSCSSAGSCANLSFCSRRWRALGPDRSSGGTSTGVAERTLEQALLASTPSSTDETG